MKPVVDESMLPKRPLIYRIGKRARPMFDRVIARFSEIGTGPLIDPAELRWTADLKKQWRTIRTEAEALTSDIKAVPPLRIMSPDHGRIAQHDLWKAFFLYGYGYRVDDNCARCPATTAIVERIPGLNSAFFSILLPGTRIEPHVGPTKGLVTCHLGLVVPANGGCRMSLHDREVGWQEGECLVFDDTYRHEVVHEGDSPRIVLLVQVKRPLRAPGRQIADLFLAGIRRSPFVQEARGNMAAWDEAMQAADRAV
ncbi:MAG TPA: aspartyl/asparaginyl beta-hydroxylase domain-containing protein [Allosphingosinicella sp.]|nr:aspartyl/asparaginyl beta-hydroxylase domain-containing protein [Allosphingosinicella sp.]